MPRGGASVQAGSVYHLISRFVAKEWFVEGEEERRAYLTLLGFALARTNWSCFAFAVMSSHIHLGLVAGTSPLRTWLRPMHTDFAQWINHRRERIGAVFVRGPKVIGIQPAGTARLINYIHNNPVRAGVVHGPRDSDWTSHRAYVDLAHKPSWLDIERGLELAGFESGPAFETWMDATSVDRADVDAMRTLPRVGRGRPRCLPTIRLEHQTPASDTRPSSADGHRAPGSERPTRGAVGGPPSSWGRATASARGTRARGENGSKVQTSGSPRSQSARMGVTCGR